MEMTEGFIAITVFGESTVVAEQCYCDSRTMLLFRSRDLKELRLHPQRFDKGRLSLCRWYNNFPGFVHLMTARLFHGVLLSPIHKEWEILSPALRP